MNPLEPDPPALPGLPGHPQVGPEPPPTPVIAPRRHTRWALIAAILAVLVSSYAGERLRGRYHHVLFPSMTLAADAKEVAAVAAASIEHAAVTYGVFGAVLGGALGLAGGLSRRSVGHAAVAALVGLFAGGAAGAGACVAVLPIHDEYLAVYRDSLLLAFLMHGAIWSAIGAAGGLALGVGLGGAGRSLRALLGGLLGAVVATIIYEALGALAFPLDKTSQPISGTWTTRMLAQGMVAVLAAVMASSCAEARTPGHEPASPPG